MSRDSKENRLVLGIPKGSLQKTTVTLFRRAGFRISFVERNYFPDIDDEDISLMMFRAQEMSRYVEEGVLDAGITGSDWIAETGSEVVEAADLVCAEPNYRRVRWVLAVPEDSPVRAPPDLQGRTVATELPNVTRRYFAERGVDVKVEFSYGATEVKPGRVADAMVDVTETGSTLRAHRLREVETVLVSTPRLIANAGAWGEKWKRRKIENIALMLHGAIEAREKVGLKMNVPKSRLQAVTDLLPAEKSPTISGLADPDWVAVEVVLEERIERDLVPRLKKAGASGIITYPLNKVIP